MRSDAVGDWSFRLPRIWLCASISPGRTVTFDRSITGTPAGATPFAPTLAMRSPSTTITTFAAYWPVRTSSSRPALMATRAGGFGGAVCCAEMWAPHAAMNTKDNRRVRTGAFTAASQRQVYTESAEGEAIAVVLSVGWAHQQGSRDARERATPSSALLR